MSHSWASWRKAGGIWMWCAAGTVCYATMWRRAVLWQLVLVASGNSDFGLFGPRRLFTPGPQVQCFDYPEWGPSRYTRGVPAGWIHPDRPSNVLDMGVYSPSPFRSNLFARRIDLHPPQALDIVREHAKLVQDINSLKQALYVAPLVDRSRDYDDSIYLEAIETTTAPWTTPTTVRSKKPGSSIPVILVGGASQHTVIKSQPLKVARPTVSLVGTSVSPLVRHPYPFVIHSSSAPPVRICMPTAAPTRPYVKPKPNLLQRILNGIVSS